MKTFCVIGNKIGTHSVPRNWYETTEEAIEHAKVLAAKSYGQNQKPVTLYVVQVVKVVEAGQPQINTRDLEQSDVGAAEAQEPD